MKYNKLSEGQQRCVVVSFEMKYGKRTHNLVNLALQRVNPDCKIGANMMEEASLASITAVLQAIIKIENEYKEIRESFLK